MQPALGPVAARTFDAAPERAPCRLAREARAADDGRHASSSVLKACALPFAGLLSERLIARRRRAGAPGQRGRGCRVPLRGLEAEFGLPSKLAATAEALKALPNDRLRYQQLMALAGKLAAMPAELKTPERKVPGCLSTVHVHASLQDDGTIAWAGDSDALISKGLVALLVNGLSGCRPDEVIEVKPEFIKASGITASLTPGRNNGFYNTFKLMVKQATDLASAGSDQPASDPAPAGNDAVASAPASASASHDADLPQLRIYNTMGRQKEDFQPQQAGVVNMYVCGVTVYDLCHLGHARVMVFFDVVARYLRHRGYTVKFVRNVTDIDDKIINRSRENGETAEALARRMELEMQRDAASLGCQPPTVEPRVSECMPEIIEMVSKLEDKRHAYTGSSGEPGGLDVYFRVRSFTEYGRLSKCSLDGNQAGARVGVGDGKEAPEDFALWKTAKENEPSWASPWGRGRPGWHIECSAMARKHLGETLDIHGGGPDLMFPHHENEIAQSEAANGKLYSQTWMHCAAVRSVGDGDEKMSKSLGNFVTIREALERFDGEAIRFYLLSSQYRQPLLYSEEALLQAKERLLKLYTSLRGAPPATGESCGAVADGETWRKFQTSMSNDFDTVGAVAAMSELARQLLQLQQADKADAGKRDALAGQLQSMGALLGILQRDPEEVLRGGASVDADFEARVDALVAERAAARKGKDFARADEIKAELTGLGVVLEDGPQGTVWRIGSLVG
uniref:Cysteine--tRNA ligase n=1 Tax=Zooxanthella nutricula TaxID=1333877 RepID=A0A6U8U6X5_9DINO|mmetsp:Transcript_104569/g.320323  ORF Transcript_104569/g.320323 Transcript_104569/m.320323 type:complete len:737 (+) Transcript_104569:65-2275(+)